MTSSIEIVLVNGRLSPGGGDADALAVAGGRVIAVGAQAEIRALINDETTVLDCEGRTVIPGIVDAHCHVLASAATSLQVDCRPAATGSVAAVVDALRRAAQGNDGWIRGFGYDDSPVGLGRHLNRHDLDRVSVDLPVRVDHRSGHACVLNSHALAAFGIDRHTADPPGGAIVRDGDGEPTGLLLEMSSWLREREPVDVPTSSGDIANAVRLWSQRMLAYGITGITDAGPDNGLERWGFFQSAVGDGTVPVRVTMMVGWRHMEQMREAGLGYGSVSEDGLLRVGHAKIMLTASAGELNPHPDRLSDMVGHAHALGFPVAIHAVERDAVVASALAIRGARSISSTGGHPPRDRIEHCGECPPDVLELVAESGAMVAPNPGFLHYDGERYLSTVGADLLPHLYPVGALVARGVSVVIGSDSPVVEPNPWGSIAGAITRRSAQGSALGGVGVGSVADALALHSGGRSIAPGMPANLAVVEPNPFKTSVDALPTVRSVATIVGGRIVWRDAPPNQ